MKFRTELVVNQELENDPFCGVVFMGSCFSDNIGMKFHELGLPSLVNPFGVIFHPVPLLKILERVTKDEEYKPSDLFNQKGEFYSLNHQGKFSGKDETDLLERLNRISSELNTSLKNSELLCLTLGTSIGYSFKGEIAANCHKLSQNLFEKSLSTVTDLTSGLISTIRTLQAKFPHLKIILTISPVRHIKDGIIQNSRSKSHLITAAHETINQLKNVFYFPSYEIMMDDLRDYRFFRTDLIHPTEMAVNYIYQQFKKFAFNNDSVFKELENFSRFKNHKLISDDEQSKMDYEEALQSKIDLLNRKYKNLNLF